MGYSTFQDEHTVTHDIPSRTVCEMQRFLALVSGKEDSIHVSKSFEIYSITVHGEFPSVHFCLHSGFAHQSFYDSTKQNKRQQIHY